MSSEDEGSGSEYEYGDLIQCEQCKDGKVIYEKNGYQCIECIKWICEQCGDGGWVREDGDDTFYCFQCLKKLGGKKGIKEKEKQKRRDYYMSKKNTRK